MLAFFDHGFLTADFDHENPQKQNQQNFDRMSEGSGATEDGDDHLGQDYVGGGDDGRYPEKAQLEEAGYRYESALRSCGHGRAQWQVNIPYHMAHMK